MGTESDKESQAIDCWTAFWRMGSRASCFERSEIELTLARAWGEFVDQLPAVARLLDLATGNGTVARCCAARARLRKLTLHIDAVDAAAIDPGASVADPEGYFRQVRFHGGVPLEALPFADASFDGIVSQFGFEYANEERAAGEAARVLAPGGRLRLVMHARDGAVSRDIGRRLERLRLALAADGPITLVLTLTRALHAGDRATVADQSPELAAAAELTHRLAFRPPPDDAALFYSREFLRLWARRERYRPADMLRAAEDGWNNASGVLIRQEQMLRVARSRRGAEQIGERFASLGLLPDPVAEVRDPARGMRIAWMLDAARDPTGSA